MIEKRETKQKRAIEETIGKTNKFFTAEDLYEKLRKDNPKIGIATVYRFLNELQKERAIHVFVCDRKNLYSKSGMSHSHFICEKCGNVRHIHLDKIDFIKKHLDGDVCHVQVEVSGVCSKCKVSN
ncbi:MAG: transcriptional repressor [Nanoarchaeota archaeon]